LGVLWLNPRMTTNLLAFDLAASVYLIVGSMHEEARLKAAYGDAYVDFQRSGVPFYFPFSRRLVHRGRRLVAARKSDGEQERR
jgi:hypothetical protein